MKKFSIIFLSLLIGSSYALAEESGKSEPNSSVPTSDSSDVLIEINDNGLVQPRLEMKSRQGMLFVLNNTSASLLSLEFDFGVGPACYSSTTPNVEFKADGKLSSTKPIVPGNFASFCSPHLGEFEFTVYGLDKYPKGLKGKLIVRPS